MKHMPFPSNDDHPLSKAAKTLEEDTTENKPPWKRISPTEQTPIMFQIHRSNGNVISYAYCDLRETRLLSAGYLQLFVFGFEKYVISIEGRHLKELADLIGLARIKSLTELGQRTFVRPESSPSIDKITIEELTGPTP